MGNSLSAKLQPVSSPAELTQVSQNAIEWNDAWRNAETIRIMVAKGPMIQDDRTALATGYIVSRFCLTPEGKQLAGSTPGVADLLAKYALPRAMTPASITNVANAIVNVSGGEAEQDPALQAARASLFSHDEGYANSIIQAFPRAVDASSVEWLATAVVNITRPDDSELPFATLVGVASMLNAFKYATTDDSLQNLCVACGNLLCCTQGKQHFGNSPTAVDTFLDAVSKNLTNNNFDLFHQIGRLILNATSDEHGLQAKFAKNAKTAPTLIKAVEKCSAHTASEDPLRVFAAILANITFEENSELPFCFPEAADTLMGALARSETAECIQFLTAVCSNLLSFEQGSTVFLNSRKFNAAKIFLTAMSGTVDADSIAAFINASRAVFAPLTKHLEGGQRLFLQLQAQEFLFPIIVKSLKYAVAVANATESPQGIEHVTRTVAMLTEGSTEFQVIFAKAELAEVITQALPFANVYSCVRWTGQAMLNMTQPDGGEELFANVPSVNGILGAFAHANSPGSVESLAGTMINVMASATGKQLFLSTPLTAQRVVLAFPHAQTAKSFQYLANLLVTLSHVEGMDADVFTQPQFAKLIIHALSVAPTAATIHNVAATILNVTLRRPETSLIFLQSGDCPAAFNAALTRADTENSLLLVGAALTNITVADGAENFFASSPVLDSFATHLINALAVAPTANIIEQLSKAIVNLTSCSDSLTQKFGLNGQFAVAVTAALPRTVGEDDAIQWLCSCACNLMSPDGAEHFFCAKPETGAGVLAVMPSASAGSPSVAKAASVLVNLTITPTGRSHLVTTNKVQLACAVNATLEKQLQLGATVNDGAVKSLCTALKNLLSAQDSAGLGSKQVLAGCADSLKKIQPLVTEEQAQALVKIVLEKLN